MELVIRIEAPELIEAINSLATAMKPATQPAARTEKSKPAEPAGQSSEPAITLETVRAKLAALSQSGKQKEVKALITSFDVQKLTDIPAEQYAEVLKKAAEL